MFTGIVQAMGRVAEIRPQPAGVRLVIDRCGWKPEGFEIRHGDSICISGVCLTVVETDAETVAFDVIGETLDCTTLGGLEVGWPVNLEPSLTANTPMGGHFVQGHVDGVGTVTRVFHEGDDYHITFEAPPELMPYIVPKGSVTTDGVSMTVASVTRNTFELALIPTTLDLTTLGKVDKGSKVNIETDIISRTVVHWLRNFAEGAAEEGGGGVTLQTLRNAGFMRDPE